MHTHSRATGAFLFVALTVASCAGTGPTRSLVSFLEEHELPADPPVVLVDLDDTVYERALEEPMQGAPAALRELARDHLVVYLTARPTYAKVPYLTDNRSDSVEFLETHGFPTGPLLTSSLCNLVWRGQGEGKIESLEQLREFGIERISLAVGDRPHDLEAYLENEFVAVERAVVILIEDEGDPDRDRGELPDEILSHEIPGNGPAWPRILAAYRNDELSSAQSWVVSQPHREPVRD